MKKSKLIKIGLIAVGVILVVLAVLLGLQAYHLHSVEVAEQVEKIGYYKEDVYINYGRHIAKNACIVGGAISAIVGVIVGYMGVTYHK